MDDQTIKEFSASIQMFEKSFSKIASDFSTKLGALEGKAADISAKTDFLKKMKQIYDEQNSRLELMEATLNEVNDRLDSIQNAPMGKSRKKKRK